MKWSDPLRSLDLRRERGRKSLNFLVLLRNSFSVYIFTQIYAIFNKGNLWKRTDPSETIPPTEFLIRMSYANNLRWCIPTDFFS